MGDAVIRIDEEGDPEEGGRDQQAEARPADALASGRRAGAGGRAVRKGWRAGPGAARRP